MVVNIHSGSRACSFLQFLAGQANEPVLRPELAQADLGPWIMTCLVAIAVCHNLHELQIESELSLAQAHLLLATARPGLAKLALVTDGAVASCGSFSRLQQLTPFEMNVETAPDHHYLLDCPPCAACIP